MKRQLLWGCVLLAAGVLSFAGDAAAFVDMGLSADGRTYVFGEYGRTDRDFQGYAEIYAVDIEKNAYVPGGIFRVQPSALTADKNGKAVFDELKTKTQWALKKYDYAPAPAENLLFVREDEGKNEFRFKDFEGSSSGQTVYYHVTLVPEVEGTGASCRSSFFISLVKENENGDVLCRSTVGNPGTKRKGITGYKIDRIFTDKSGRSLVFVIEKSVADSTGTSIRYMVETVRL
ncbi:MAG: DUF2259 domain-containing protein [Treponema sp.]|nr:DUF2259 domain-containing protein [Treponema sp.]